MNTENENNNQTGRDSDLSMSVGSVPTTMLPPLPSKEVLRAPERREIRGYTATQMMDYAYAAVAATWKAGARNELPSVTGSRNQI